MSDSPSGAPRPGAAATSAPTPIFVTGSTMRHVVVMTATGSLGLVAVFLVDFLNLFYIAQLGEQELAAAIGYAGTLSFFLISFGIGISIAATALVSRALGAGRREDARRLAASSLLYMGVTLTVFSLALMPFLDEIMALLGATGRTKDLAVHFLVIVVPSSPLVGLGMALAGILRSVGDARRSMYVTLGGAFVAAILDPIFIFGFGWGITGAAIVSVLSRLALLVIGLHGAVRVHDLIARPRIADGLSDARALSAIAVPAILTNIATPVGNAWVTGAIAPHGDSAVAGWAVIGRIIPVVFGALFALSGAIGPILGQNLGARRFDRLRSTMRDALLFIAIYSVVVWVILVLLRHPIVELFDVGGRGAELVLFFCTVVAGTFLFNGALFVANAAFNNLGHPTYSTLFNWGRATVGTVPFCFVGDRLMGAEGVVLGQGIGSAVFGIAAIVVCFRVLGRTESGLKPPEGEPPPAGRVEPAPFSSGKDATIG